MCPSSHKLEGEQIHTELSSEFLSMGEITIVSNWSKGYRRNRELAIRRERRRWKGSSSPRPYEGLCGHHAWHRHHPALISSEVGQQAAANAHLNHCISFDRNLHHNLSFDMDPVARIVPADARRTWPAASVPEVFCNLYTCHYNKRIHRREVGVGFWIWLSGNENLLNTRYDDGSELMEISNPKKIKKLNQGLLSFVERKMSSKLNI
jgi:hypothetical protein